MFQIQQPFVNQQIFIAHLLCARNTANNIDIRKLFSEFIVGGGGSKEKRSSQRTENASQVLRLTFTKSDWDTIKTRKRTQICKGRRLKSSETEELEKRAEESACTHSLRKEKIVFTQKQRTGPSMVGHAFNPKVWVAEAGKSL